MILIEVVMLHEREHRRPQHRCDGRAFEPPSSSLREVLTQRPTDVQRDKEDLNGKGD